MKIRLLGTGYDKFTGAFGCTEFVDGVSVHDVSDVDARFYAAIMPVENMNGEDPGECAQFQASMQMSATTVTMPTLAELQAQGLAPIDESAPVAQVVPLTYTQEALEAVADKQGIAGLRLIANEFDVKGTSIGGIISDIIAKQTATKPQAEMLAEGQPDVDAIEDSGLAE